MIAVAMRCPCGAHAVVDITPAFTSEDRWSCKCPECHDPSSSSSRRTCLGHGETPEQAVAAWWEQVEASWDLPRYEPNDLERDIWLQIVEERERTEGWRHSSTSRDGTPRWFAPAGAELPPIPVAWPEVAP